jgi:arginyl-tRNA synthetase
MTDHRQRPEDVGNDARRFFYYLQYAHARVASVMKQLGARDLTFDRAEGLANASLLVGSQEQAVLKEMARYPEGQAGDAQNRLTQGCHTGCAQ